MTDNTLDVPTVELSVNSDPINGYIQISLEIGGRQLIFGLTPEEALVFADLIHDAAAVLLAFPEHDMETQH